MLILILLMEINTFSYRKDALFVYICLSCFPLGPRLCLSVCCTSLVKLVSGSWMDVSSHVITVQ